MLKKLLGHFFAYFIACLFCAQLLPGVHFNQPSDFVIVAIVLILLNMTLKPVLQILTFPITLLTLGMFSLIVNAIIVIITDIFVDGFWLDNFLWAFLFGIVFGITAGIIEMLLKPATSYSTPRRDDRHR